MKPTISQVNATVRAVPVYRCEQCKITAQGDTVTIILEGIAPAEIAACIGETYISNSHMPVGWAGYGVSSHKCPRCKT